MSKRTGFLISLTLLLLISCNKEPVELAIQNEPVFTVNALLGEDTLLIEAGKGGYYMFTDNGAKTNTSYYDPISRFAKEDGCEVDCQESFRIEFTNFTEETLADFKGPSSITVGAEESYPFFLDSTAPNLSTVYEVSLEDRSFYSGSSFESDISWTSSTSSPMPVSLVDTFPVLGFDITIIQSIGSQNDLTCSGNYTQHISLDPKDQCFIELGFSIGTDSILTIAHSNANLSFGWSDGTQGGTQFIPEDGVYCFTITDNESGCVNERCVYVHRLGQADMSYCSPAFSYRVVPIEMIEQQESIITTKVMIAYTTKDGVEYRSGSFQQPGASNFLIKESSSYEPNSNGQPTSLVRADLKCSLFNELGEALILENGKIVFALALP